MPAAVNYALILFTGIVSAVSPLAAQAYGSRNQKKVGTIARLGLGISLILAIPIALLFCNGGSLLLLLGQDANTAALAQTYLRAIALGFIPALGFTVLKSFLSALLQPRLVMVTVVLGTLLNIAANYVLMFGKLGFPAMGLAGIGWASTFSLWSMFIALTVYICNKPQFAVYGIFQPSLYKAFTLEHRHIIGEIFQVGLPIGGLIAVEVGLFTVVTFLIGQLGTNALAAHQIALQTISMYSNFILYGYYDNQYFEEGYECEELYRARIQHFNSVGIHAWPPQNIKPILQTIINEIPDK